uniref:2,3-dihydroxyphenylpropionate/2,3-dihydroxicinnamic acid 1,2-dioxygenase 2 n=1 Tax=Dechloromonas aromatica (strain RCB) TaxID=159087 RepID=MHPB2_DECAR|nr:RecName: Full=2,3-dihydroxyphenylpropionate/2,3-dihydroxicinnamic acid 1,2-dioxygenase 2; AltName: Full=3-carboxyethylcatechol 2,3-dioxygenase 2 [Dechloromonas aromatica RCB]
MAALLQCISHSPMKGYVDPSPAIVSDVEVAIARMRKELVDFDPEVIFLFAPDHYNGFFLDVMPQFCVGIAATSVGDYRTTPGPINVPREIARSCAEHLISNDIDVAISYRMQVDHGMVQPLEELMGGLNAYPVVPLFVNGVAPPLISIRRARLFGAAVGEYAKKLNKRCLFIGSGGLSHNPPVPQIDTATEEFAEFLIAGRNPSPERRAARQQRTKDAAIRFAAGDSQLHPINSVWDEAFMADLVNQDWGALDAYRNSEITEQAGISTHEAKSWVAAHAAMNAATSGGYMAEVRYYKAIPEWIVGYGAMAGSAEQAT